MKDDEMECRCSCGALIARRTESGIELKCRRCKRTWRMLLNDLTWVEGLSSPSRPEDMIPAPLHQSGN